MATVKVRTRQTCPDCGRLMTWHCAIVDKHDPWNAGRKPWKDIACTFQRDESACQCPWTINAEKWESERVAEDLLVATR